MTIRNLDVTLAPASIALIGASSREGSVGRVVLENVVSGGFAGRIYPVNPKHGEVLGLRCYSRVADLPEAPDLAIIMTPPETVPGLIADLGARGAKAAVVITAGINDANGLRQKMLAAARPHMLRIIGPNTIGLLAPHAALNASFVHITPKPGRLGLISQSGAIVSSVIDWAAAEGIGFSGVYSLGDMADVDVGDCLNMLAADAHTTAILMYLESIPATRKFMSAARAAARIKPVIAVKPGRHAEAAKAAQTHTGALAGADRVIDAALTRAGIIRVDDLEDLFNAAEITARFTPDGNRPCRHRHQWRRRRRARRRQAARSWLHAGRPLGRDHRAARRDAAADLVARQSRSTSSAMHRRSAIWMRLPRPRQTPASMRCW